MDKALLLFVLISFLSCTNDVSEVDSLTRQYTVSTETATNVEILYSDSADIKVKITAPTLIKILDKRAPRDEFPDGIHVDFFGPNKKVTSWLDANTAIREEKTGLVYARKEVKLYNNQNEKLETPELIWDEKEQLIYTDKIVRITQPEKGDTSIGIGFTANQEFTRFEIKKKFSGKISVKEMAEKLKGDQKKNP